MCSVSGSETIGSSPQMYRPLIFPSIAAGNTSVALSPGLSHKVTPQAFSNFFLTSGLSTF